jgi:cytochrome c biogenesis protein CcdA/thiol-disulfide isomerase/thioredoxin
MAILILFAFIAGIVTILSPCILPILPVILASSVTDPLSRRRPYGIVVGFILSFTFFTLFLSSLVKAFGVPADSLRTVSVVVIAVFGLSLLLPRFQSLVESLFSRLANLMPSTAGRTGFGGGILIGLSLGLLWTPCVGPILASVISLAISGTVTLDAFFLTLAYSLGTAIPMYLIIQGGGRALVKFPWLLSHTAQIQRAFGVVMIATALLIHFRFDRRFQTYILTQFPQYGAGLTKLETNPLVESRLNQMDITYEPAPDFIAGGQWFNSDPLTIEGLKGKVVLVDFWTYTCINCQRTFPYLKSWHEKYQDLGLVIVGVHTPEFEFEKDGGNVQQALLDFGIKYPVMQDNDFATWRAYHNRFWPAKYLLDAKGQIRYTHFGEGDYDETEAMIQTLLQESGVTPTAEINNPSYRTYGRTPEIYLGTLRGGSYPDLSYAGDWTDSDEYRLAGKGAELKLRFNAKTVYLVMKPVGETRTVKVYLGDDFVKEVEVTKNTLYELVDLDAPATHNIRLVFPDGNVEIYAFTFG